MAFNAAPFGVTGVTAGGTPFTGGSRGSRTGADTPATNTVPSPAAEHSVVGDAGICARGAVAVLAGPAAPAHAFPAGALAIVSAEQSFVSHAGEIVTLTERPVNVSIGRQVADALAAVAVTSAAARGLPGGLSAGVRAQHVLATLAVRTHVAWVAGTHPTLEGAVAIVAFGAVYFHFLLTVTAALGTDEDFQGVSQAHGLYDNVLASLLAVGYAHGHVEGSCVSDLHVRAFLLVWEEGAVTDGCE